jgi:acyl carrier protein
MDASDKVVEVLAGALDYTVDELREEEEISMEVLPEWDSLTHTQVILALEKAFECKLPGVQASQATTLADLVTLVESARG